ncbi:hypothetical protein [Micromonospora maris]|uniref:hypothetical protein n=1 Tax=Micromonospora maris TaxID=1003110 RepID=UPI002E162C0C|nr:hypothetical protein OG712_19545 [Micromonospora maris]
MTLDDLTAMMAEDENHRYEISPEQVLSIMPPPGYAHAIIATRLMVWFAQGDVPADRIAQTVVAVGLSPPPQRWPSRDRTSAAPLMCDLAVRDVAQLAPSSSVICV